MKGFPTLEKLLVVECEWKKTEISGILFKSVMIDEAYQNIQSWLY